MSGTVEETTVPVGHTWVRSEPANRAGGRPPQVSGPRWRAGAADLAVVAALTCLALAQLIHHARSDDPQLTWYVVLSALLILPLAGRRRFPLPVLGLISAVMLAQLPAGIQLIAGVSLLVAVYSVSTRYPLRIAGPGAVVAAATAVPVMLRAGHDLGWTDVTVTVSALVVAALMCGAYVRNRSIAVGSLIAAAEQLERERDQAAQLAAAQERTRIAREMHDIIAHSLSVMVALADAAALKAPAHADQAAATMARVSDVGRQALGDSRRVFGVLRDDDTGPLSPQPGLADLDTLVGQFQHAGLSATLIVTGPVNEVPPVAALTVYRIVQEAITNSVKHARGAGCIRVEVTVAGTAVTVQVHDDGRPAELDLSAQPSGHGIRGMRERVKAYGGTVTAGPAVDGGWDVRAAFTFAREVTSGDGRA